MEQDEVVWESRFKRFFLDILPEVRDESEKDEFGKINYKASFKQAYKNLKNHFNNQEALDDCLAFRCGDLDRLKIILAAENWKERFARPDCYGKSFYYFLRLQKQGHHRQAILDLIYKKYQSVQVLSKSEIENAAQCGQLDLIKPLFNLIYDENIPPVPEVNQRYNMDYWSWYSNVKLNNPLGPNKMTLRQVYPTVHLPQIASKAVEFNHEDLYKFIESSGEYEWDQFSYNGQRNIFNILDSIIRNQREVVLTKHLADRIFNLLTTFPEMQVMPNIAALTPIMQSFVAYEANSLVHMGLFFWAVVLKQEKYIADCKFSEEDKRLLDDDERKKFFYNRTYKHAASYFIALIEKGCMFFGRSTSYTRSGEWHWTGKWLVNEAFDRHPLYFVLATRNYALLKKIVLNLETTPDVKRYLLEAATMRDDVFAFKFIVKNGGIVNDIIINTAVSFNSFKVLKLIVAQPYDQSVLHEALIKRPSADIFSILPDDFDFDRKASCGSTLLSAVVTNIDSQNYEGVITILKTLIERGADPFFESDDTGPGRTARERLEIYAGYALKQFLKDKSLFGRFFKKNNILEILEGCLNDPEAYLSKLDPNLRQRAQIIIDAWDYINRIEYERLEPEFHAGLSSI
ncbi:MAG: hypothetical protein WAW86_01160 [Gammaproteobacteria bacterium]